MKVSAIIVTRGNVDLQPVLDSLPSGWEQVVWDNGGAVSIYDPAAPGCFAHDSVRDLSVYGRYAAIEYASHDLIYVADDDVIVSDPQAIVRAWIEERDSYLVEDSNTVSQEWVPPFLVANMPQEFRHEGYTDSCLVGFGACFHRDLPERAFERYYEAYVNHLLLRGSFNGMWKGEEVFNRTCDVVFTTLTPRVLVDVSKTDREFASDSNRMWKQPQHYGERVRMLELARQVRDA